MLGRHRHRRGQNQPLIYDIRDCAWQAAFDFVVGELTRLRLIDHAVIARSVAWETEDDEWTDYTVFWPKGYDQAFSIW
jgi:hypothetical protein